MGFTMPPSTMRAICEKTPRARTDAVGEDGADGEDDEEGGSSGMTQSTRTTTESTRGTSSWKRRETREQRPSALTSPMRLKMTRSNASGRRSKWSSPAAPESQRSSPPRSHRQRRDPAGSSDIGGGGADRIWRGGSERGRRGRRGHATRSVERETGERRRRGGGLALALSCFSRLGREDAGKPLDLPKITV